MTTGFPLLRLPFLAQKAIISLMEPAELILHSLHDRKIKTLVKKCNIKVQLLTWNIASSDLHFQIIFDPGSTHFFLYAPSLTSQDFESSGFDINRWDQKIMLRPKSRAPNQASQFEYLKKYSEIFKEFLRIENYVLNSDFNSMDEFLTGNIWKVTENSSLKICDTGFGMEGFNRNFIWDMDCAVLRINKIRLSSEFLTTFIQNWIDGAFWNLKDLGFTSIENRSEIFIEGLETVMVESRPEAINRKLHPYFAGNSMNVQRKIDGRIASFAYTNISFRFLTWE